MITVHLDGKSGNVYNVNDFPYSGAVKEIRHVEWKKKKIANAVFTFDIETTNMYEGERWSKNWAFMYVWQFGIVKFNEAYEITEEWCCIGRTWESFKEFIERLSSCIPADWTIPIYVHNLQFEFQFFRNFLTPIQNVFARKRRQVVECEWKNVQFRCSFVLSNMSLDKFCKSRRGVNWYKQTGKFDYSIIRYPDTELSHEELLYCVCDVLGLGEALVDLLRDSKMNLGNIPKTSTGFVRMDYRKKCLSDVKHMKRFNSGRLNSEQYILLNEASRGGIAGSNACNTGWTIFEADSEDIKSSYPYQMATKYYPQGRFNFVKCTFGNDAFMHYLNHYCCIIVWSAEDFKLKEWNSIPYISHAKCKQVRGGMCGNGKVYGAKEIGMCCTEIDLRIIMEKYTFRNPVVYKVMVADRGMLSKAFREHLLEMFQMKTDLEGGDKYLYDKYKNKINSSFGMMLTDILRPDIIYDPKGEVPFLLEKVQDFDEGLEKYYNGRNSFLNYQDGVWVLAHGRDSLNDGMNIVGSDIIQVDTDSVKHVNDYMAEFNALNRNIMEMAEGYDVKPYAYRNDGSKVYLGVWEHEQFKGSAGMGKSTYKTFRTLGAKKYFYTDWNDELHITVSGVGKEEGKSYIESHGGLEIVKPGMVIPPEHSGRLVAYYNDEREIITKCIDGHFVTYGSNVCLRPGSYTVGVTDEWEEMIQGDWDWEFDASNEGVESEMEGA